MNTWDELNMFWSFGSTRDRPDTCRSSQDRLRRVEHIEIALRVLTVLLPL